MKTFRSLKHMYFDVINRRKNELLCTRRRLKLIKFLQEQGPIS